MFCISWGQPCMESWKTFKKWNSSVLFYRQFSSQKQPACSSAHCRAARLFLRCKDAICSTSLIVTTHSLDFFIVLACQRDEHRSEMEGWGGGGEYKSTITWSTKAWWRGTMCTLVIHLFLLPVLCSHHCCILHTETCLISFFRLFLLWQIRMDALQLQVRVSYFHHTLLLRTHHSLQHKCAVSMASMPSSLDPEKWFVHSRCTTAFTASAVILGELYVLPQLSIYPLYLSESARTGPFSRMKDVRFTVEMQH